MAARACRSSSSRGGRSTPNALQGWISHAAKRCVAALEAGRPAPPAVLELSEIHDQPTFVLAPGHDLAMVEEFARLAGVGAGAERGGHEHDRLPAINADAFWVPELDRFVSEHEPWVAPEALDRLQQIREEHARSAGLVALSAATDRRPRFGPGDARR